jgi:hypothetical protein
MKRCLFPLLSMLNLVVLQPPAAFAQSAGPAYRAGEVFEVRVEQVSQTSGHMSSSSRDIGTLTERVIALRDGGSELEFDLPSGTSADDRARAWQYPVRVFRPAKGALQLLNTAEVEKRLRVWLDDMDRSMCGRWVFTWTAEKIDCDPQSALNGLDRYLSPADIRDGALHVEPGARGPSALYRQGGVDASILRGDMEIDAEAVRRQRADVDMAVRQLSGQTPITTEAALQAHTAERISGSLSVTFDLDARQLVIRRTLTSRLDIEDASEEHTTATEITQWRLLSPSQPRRN